MAFMRLSAEGCYGCAAAAVQAATGEPGTGPRRGGRPWLWIPQPQEMLLSVLWGAPNLPVELSGSLLLGLAAPHGVGMN